MSDNVSILTRSTDRAPWAGEFIMLFEDMVSACHRARDRGAKALWSASHFAREFDGILKRGRQADPHPDKRIASRVRCLLERLKKHKDDYLRFLRDLSLPFTNNEAERDLRMLKVKGKISGCFRTTGGADKFCRLRSYTTTCRKQKMPLLECVRSLFQNQIIMPALAAE